MRRIPLRLKLTLVFTGVMAVLLAAARIALSVLVAANLDSTIDDGLAARAGDQAAVAVATRGNEDARLERSGETFAQGFEGGRGPATTQGRAGEPLLTREELERASRGSVITQRRVGSTTLRLY